MVETHEIRVGAKVAGSRGESFGSVDEVRMDPVSGEPKTFVISTGFWLMKKRKELSVDVIRQVNNDPDTIILDVAKNDFRRIPALAD